MNAGDWAAIVGMAVTVVAGFTGAIRWLVKSYLHELVPNSGSSIKDKVNRLEQRVDEIYVLLLERK